MSLTYAFQLLNLSSPADFVRCFCEVIPAVLLAVREQRPHLVDVGFVGHEVFFVAVVADSPVADLKRRASEELVVAAVSGVVASVTRP